MHLRLGPDTLATPTEGCFTATVRYNLDVPAVSIGGAAGPQAHEELLRSTFGSVDWLWSGDDEFRFERSSRALVSARLRVPEVDTLPCRVARSWLNAEPTPVTLMALSDESFSAPPVVERWVSKEADWLVCARTTSLLSAAGNIQRLRISESLDLVFQENVYSGWILRDPADHLVRGFEEPLQHTAPKSLRHAFKEYISFFTQTNHDLMADEDFTTLTRLEELQHELLRLPVDTRSKALFEHVSDQRERWYGK